MTAYYNEIDPYCAEWLRNLIRGGHIAPGDIDERSIVDVRPDDLRSYIQCHFFAGIGGWSLALRLAGWPDDRPVWTGSCPCQPFSAAGAGKAANDERHLWPAWFPLIAECRPTIVFGEQVEAAIGWGWLDAVFSDLEGQGYACGASVLPACGVGAPHIRQRLWFLANADGGNASAKRLQRSGEHGQQSKNGRAVLLAHPASQQVGLSRQSRPLGDATGDEQRQPRLAEAGNGWQGAAGGSSPWCDCEWLPCTDGKARPTKPGIRPLAHGIPARVGKLRAAGNAIVPQVAAEFIRCAHPGHER